jgi:multidrug efflux pump subunit AcrA (membrane-fusion protein)
MTAYGRVEALAHTAVVSPEGGQVAALLGHAGQSYLAGDPILRLTNRQLEQQYAQCQLERAFAQANWQSVLMPPPLISGLNIPDMPDIPDTLPGMPVFPTIPLPNNPIPVQSSTSALFKSRYNALTTQLNALQHRLNSLTVRMPHAGRLVALYVKPGEQLSPQTTVAKITAWTPSVMTLRVSRQIAQLLTTGQGIKLQLPHTFMTMQADAQVVTLEAPTSRRRKTAWVTVQVHGRIPFSVHPRQVLRLAFQTAGRGNVWVPAHALQIRHEYPVVYVVKEATGRFFAYERAITPGQGTDTEVEILAGLSPKDQVIVEGAEKLTHHQEVAIKTLKIPNSYPF